MVVSNAFQQCEIKNHHLLILNESCEFDNKAEKTECRKRIERYLSSQYRLKMFNINIWAIISQL